MRKKRDKTTFCTFLFQPSVDAHVLQLMSISVFNWFDFACSSLTRHHNRAQHEITPEHHISAFLKLIAFTEPRSALLSRIPFHINIRRVVPARPACFPSIPGNVPDPFSQLSVFQNPLRRFGAAELVLLNAVHLGHGFHLGAHVGHLKPFTELFVVGWCLRRTKTELFVIP